ncbi:MAG: helix-turn-helix domain-containing protein [Clostridia bacterium]|nr:helix-turn-helix domain-containing protein [Clostridia bacterium]
MDFGKKISALRKSKGMTQEDLGKVLNVTYQAVSKWERDESLPDIEMMSRIAKFFEVPIDYFVDGETATTAAGVAASAPPPAHVGVCTHCGRMLTEEEAYSLSPKIICKSCAELIRKNDEQKRIAQENMARERKDKEIAEQCGHGVDASLVVSLILSVACFILFTVLCFKFPDSDGFYGLLVFLVPIAVFGGVQLICDFIKDCRYDDFDEDIGYTRNISLIIAGVFALLNLACLLTVYIYTGLIIYVFIMIAATILSFTFISQYMWGNVVKSMFSLGGATFKIPGFIITLDIDSIIWMLVVKLILGILAAIVFVITLTLVVVFSIVASAFTFIPCVVVKSIKDTKARTE